MLAAAKYTCPPGKNLTSVGLKALSSPIDLQASSYVVCSSVSVLSIHTGIRSLFLYLALTVAILFNIGMEAYSSGCAVSETPVQKSDGRPISVARPTASSICSKPGIGRIRKRYPFFAKRMPSVIKLTHRTKNTLGTR